MKPIILFLALFFSSCCSTHLVTEDFKLDLANANSTVWGNLYRNVFHKNLDTLKFSFYINYLREHEESSYRGTADKIMQADLCDFITGKQKFVITLYYEGDKTVLSDNCLTEMPDTSFITETEPTTAKLRQLSLKIFEK